MEESAQSSRNLRTVFSGAVIVFLSQMIGYFLYFITQRFILSSLSIEENGAFTLIQKIATVVFALVGEAGMSNTAFRKVVQNPEKRVEILNALLMARIFFISICFVILLVPTFLVAPNYALSVFIFSLYWITTAKSVLLRTVFEMKLRSETRLSLISFLGVAENALLTLLLFFDHTHLTINRVFVWFLCASLPGFLTIVYVGSEKGMLRTNFSRSTFRELFSESIPALASVAFIYGIDALDPWLIGFFSTLSEVGVFGASSRTVAPFLAVFSSITAVLFPLLSHLYKENIEECRVRIMDGFALVLFITIGSSLLCVVGAPIVIELLTQGKYVNHAEEFALFFWLNIPLFAVQYAMFVNIALGFQHRNSQIAGALVAAGLLADFLLIPSLGAKGAIWAKIIGNICAFTLALYYFREIISLNILSRFLVKYGILTILSLMISAVLSQFLLPLSAVLAAMPIFVLLAFISGAVGRREVQLAKLYFEPILRKLRSHG